MISEFVLVEKSITVLVPATPGGGGRGAAPAPPAITAPAWETQLSKDLKSCPIAGRFLPQLIKDTPIFVPPALQTSAGYPKATTQIETAVQAGGVCGRVKAGQVRPAVPALLMVIAKPFLALVSVHRREWRQQRQNIIVSLVAPLGGAGGRIRVDQRHWYQKIRGARRLEKKVAELRKGRQR